MDKIEEFKKIISESNNIVFFFFFLLSTESGIFSLIIQKNSISFIMIN